MLVRYADVFTRRKEKESVVAHSLALPFAKGLPLEIIVKDARNQQHQHNDLSKIKEKECKFELGCSKVE